jgi:hypothetical protein
MLWFKKSKQSTHITELERQVTIEVQHHKNASAKEVAKTNKIVNNFNKVINQNNFTIRIHSAAGGKH